jgi:hypothetical protein
VPQSSDSYAERLTTAVEDQQPDRLLDLLLLDRRETARTWYDKGGRKLAKSWRDAGRGKQRQGRVVELLLAVALAKDGAEAVTFAEWGPRLEVTEFHSVAFTPVLEMAVRRGREFCAELLAAGAAVPGRADVLHCVTAEEYFRLAVPLIEVFGLELPDAVNYPRGWAKLMRDWWAGKAYSEPQPITFVDAEGKEAGALDPAGGVWEIPHHTPCQQRLWELAVGDEPTLGFLHSFEAEIGSYPKEMEPWSIADCLADALEQGTRRWNGTASRDPGPRSAFASRSQDDQRAKVQRGPLLEHALRALAVTMRPGAQRATAKIITALEPSPDDLRPHTALLAGAFATADSTVVKALLGPLLDAELNDEDLHDIGRTILARKEKALKKTLLNWLIAHSGPIDLLEEFAALDDLALSKAAEKALPSD